MNKNRIVIGAISLIFFACTKPQLAEISATNAVNSAENVTAAATIKTIARSAKGITTDRYTFTYRTGRIDSIKHQTFYRGGENDFIKLQYPGTSTTPSGYRFSKHAGNFNVIASFIIDGGKIVSKTKVPDFSNPFEECDTAASNAYTYLNTKLIKNKPSFNNAPLYDGLITIDYNALKNVKQTRLLGGSQETITNKKYDDKINPFNVQNKLLYYASFRPFAAFKKSEEYLFDFIMLAANNPISFSYIDNGGLRVTGYKLKYQYNAANLPTQVIVLKTDLSDPTVPPPPYVEVERLTITY